MAETLQQLGGFETVEATIKHVFAVLQRFLHKADSLQQHRHLSPPTNYLDKGCPLYAGSSLVYAPVALRQIKQQQQDIAAQESLDLEEYLRVKRDIEERTRQCEAGREAERLARRSLL